MAPIIPGLDRASVELYGEVAGEPGDEGLRHIDGWFYRANHDLDNRRPIDLMASPEGIESVRAFLVRMSAGVVG